MSTSESRKTADISLWRAALHVARYYLGNRWIALALGGFVIIIGAALNWSWLVTAGIAPILLRWPPVLSCARWVCAP